MIARAKRWLIALLAALGADHLVRWLHRRQLLVVCYHGVTDAAASWRGWWHLVPQPEFERQIAYLSRHYRIVSVDQAIEELRAGRLRTPTACITFDDGYLNNRTVALPILEKLRVPATVFLATGLIGTDRRLWTTRLEWKLRQRGRALTAISQLKRVAPAARERALAALYEELGTTEPDDAAAFGMMDWSDVRAMEATGLISFGAHTVNHEILTPLTEAEQQREVAGSLDALSGRVVARSGTFAYPNGEARDFDARSIAALRRAGVTAAFSTIEGLNDRETDVYALRRVLVGGDTSFNQFRIMTSGLIAAFKRTPAAVSSKPRRPAYA